MRLTSSTSPRRSRTPLSVPSKARTTIWLQIVRAPPLVDCVLELGALQDEFGVGKRPGAACMTAVEM